MPQNGLVYGRVGSDFYRGPQIARTAILRSDAEMSQPDPETVRRISSLLAAAQDAPAMLPDSLFRSFMPDSAAVFSLGNAEIGDCSLRGRVVLYGDELRIDSTCRMEHLLVVARKITVGQRRAHYGPTVRPRHGSCRSARRAGIPLGHLCGHVR